MKFISKKSIRIPPPIVTFVFGMSMYALSFVIHWQFIFSFQEVIVIALILSGILLLLPAVLQFIQHKTTVNPLNPEKASRLVVSGLFRFSRNPMYLGMALLLLAWGIYLGNPLNIIIFIGFIAYMNCFQISLEEKALEALFGEEFSRYKARVRRWI